MEGVGAFAILEEGGAEGVFPGIGLLGDQGIEDLGFEAVHAALGPVGGDDLFEEEFLFGSDGLIESEVGSGKFDEVGFVLAGDDEGFGGGGMLQGIEAGGGLALSGARAGGFPGVEPVGGDLSGSGHQIKKRPGGAALPFEGIVARGSIEFRRFWAGFVGRKGNILLGKLSTLIFRRPSCLVQPHFQAVSRS